jgi:hypothetical protein
MDARTLVYDIYVQRVDSVGVAQWTANGVAVCVESGHQYGPYMIPDGAGGAIMNWIDYRTAVADIYSQRVDSSGVGLWGTDGMAVCTAADGQLEPVICSDGVDGAIVAWYDQRTGEYDIYAQRLGAYGQTGGAPAISSVLDVPRDQGGKVKVAWHRSGIDGYPIQEITHYSVWRSVPVGTAASFAELGTVQELAGSGRADQQRPMYRSIMAAGTSYEWQWIADVQAHYFEDYSYIADSMYDSMGTHTGYQHFLVSAHTSNPFVFWDSAPDSGYSVDNLAPSTPMAVTAEYGGGGDLFIHWNPNTEIDLSHYAVYRGADSGFVPDETNRVGTVTDTSFVDAGIGFDGVYYYKVSAIDIHENESPFALLTPEMITGVPGDRPHLTNVLFQNTPNPFLSSTRIVFSMTEAGRVRLQVFDAKGRLVRVLADEVRQANRYVEAWDSRDDNGRQVPAGTYFYSLEAPGWTASKKMTLAR